MTHSGRSLRLGTRGSLLAVAQSRLVREAFLAQHPELRVDIVTIETSGDRDQTTPLDQVGDADFFSAELDRALLDGRIDFAVHSMKDLNKSRPTGICLAAVPARENPRDAIVFRADVAERLRSGVPLRIGSSSHRRRHNVAKFLPTALPNLGATVDLQFMPLRGAVDQRVARITGDADAPGALDGVVLALAGLARLWQDPDGRARLEPPLEAARWMVLPLSECPTAPAQGALAVECRTEDEYVRSVLSHLHDAPTDNLVRRELDLMNTLPEEARSSFGATAIEHPSLGAMLYRRNADGSTGLLDWNAPEKRTGNSSPITWDGGDWQKKCGRSAVSHTLDYSERMPIFVAHWFAASRALEECPDPRIWVSGTASWRALAERGIWVEGCAENLGFAAITSTLSCDVLQLPEPRHWTILTRRGAETGWRNSGIRKIVATYELRTPDSNSVALHTQLAATTDFFWGSAEQFRSLAAWVPRDARHACGAGKTANALMEAGVEKPLVFPSRREWRAWLR